MTDDETDVYRYWRRKCNICENKYPDKYLKCNRNINECDAKINIQFEEHKYIE